MVGLVGPGLLGQPHLEILMVWLFLGLEALAILWALWLIWRWRP